MIQDVQTDEWQLFDYGQKSNVTIGYQLIPNDKT